MIINFQTFWPRMFARKQRIKKALLAKHLAVRCAGLLKRRRCCFMQAQMEEARFHACGSI